MGSLFEYYRMKTNENDEIVFQRVKEEDITICGKSIKEIVTILNGLEVERMTDIEMTMKNLSCLFDKVMKEQDKILQRDIAKMVKGIKEIY